MRPIYFDAIFSSDLARAHRTAEILTVDRQLAIETTHLLREIYGGDYDGKPYDLFLADHRTLLEELGDATEEEQRRVRVGNVETDEELMKRFITVIRELAVGYSGKTVLVVTRGGCLRRFLHHLGWASREQLPPKSFSNCGYVKLLCDA